MRSYQILLVLFVVGLSVQNQVYLEAVSCAEGCYYQQFAQICLCADGSLFTPTRQNVNFNGNGYINYHERAQHETSAARHLLFNAHDEALAKKAETE